MSATLDDTRILVPVHSISFLLNETYARMPRPKCCAVNRGFEFEPGGRV
jgi:hypothetical protein